MNRRERTRRILAAQNPLQHPPMTARHVVGLVMVIALAWIAVAAPGPLADVSRATVGGWEAFVLARLTVIFLCGYALFFVRSYHWIVAVGLTLTIVGLCLRIGVGQITGEPLTVGFSLLLLALVSLPLRIIVRPNDRDRIRTLEAQVRELEEQC